MEQCIKLRATDVALPREKGGGEGESCHIPQALLFWVIVRMLWPVLWDGRSAEPFRADAESLPLLA